MVSIDKGSTLGNLSMTPLIDVVFLLLIFFLVGTQMAGEEQDYGVLLPQASEAKPLVAQTESLVVQVLADGTFTVDGDVLSPGQLSAVLRRAWKNNLDQQKVLIKADQESRTKHIAQVMNLCHQAGIKHYTLATQAKGS